MPKMSGLELLTILKSDELTKNMGVILLTAHHRGSSEVSDGLTMGADDYIKRPFMKDEFMSRVRAVVRLKRAEAKAQSQARLTTQRNNGLQLVNDLALVVNSSLNLDEILATSLQKLSALTKADVVVLLVLNENKELVVTASSVLGQRVSRFMGVRSLDEIHQLVKQKEIIPLIVKVLADCQQELNLKNVPPSHLIHHTPMLSREQEVGVIAVVNKPGEVFDELDWQVIHSAAAIIAVAIGNARLFAEIQKCNCHSGALG
jgi:CheY-like chemotaxis protein